MTKRNSLVIIAVIIAAFIVGALVLKRGGGQTPPASPTPAASQSQAGPNEQVPNLSFTDYNGRTVALADFRGKPLVVNAWASWCPFCRKELPDFAAAQKEFGDKVVIIAVDRAEPLGTAKKYSDGLGVTNNLVLLLDPNDSLYQAIGGFSMPETIFVDKNGNIREHKRGPIDLGEMRQKINALLQS